MTHFLNNGNYMQTYDYNDYEQSYDEFDDLDELYDEEMY